ncbi:hypothetical protein DFH29DRAFT_942049 [Suillus ampliporus]|nr:hypothetical protein DFH29DRAFT_942049 [Suillus ampliporus]
MADQHHGQQTATFITCAICAPCLMLRHFVTSVSSLTLRTESVLRKSLGLVLSCLLYIICPPVVDVYVSSQLGWGGPYLYVQVISYQKQNIPVNYVPLGYLSYQISAKKTVNAGSWKQI